MPGGGFTGSFTFGLMCGITAPKKVSKKAFGMEEMQAYNEKLLADEGEEFALNDTTALGTLSVAENDAKALYIALKHAFGRGVYEGYKDGELYVSHSTSSTRNRWMAYAGFSTYALNHGDEDDNNGARQKKCTTVIPGKDVNFLTSAMPPIKPFVDLVRDYAGMDIAFIDILRQSSTGINGGKESLFQWHRDNDGDRTKVRLTIIFILTPTKSSMQVCGYKEMEYGKQGAGVAFMSKMWHRSCAAEDGTMKIAFFMSGKIKRAQNKSWKQCICGKLDPPSKKRGWVEETWIQCDKCNRWCHEFCAKKRGKISGDSFVCCE